MLMGQTQQGREETAVGRRGRSAETCRLSKEGSRTVLGTCSKASSSSVQESHEKASERDDDNPGHECLSLLQVLDRCIW